MILLNDDYTPREFVVQVLKAVFRMNEDAAYRVMMTAHRRGACVIAVYTRDVAETKAKEATDLGKQQGLSAVLHDRAGRIGRPSRSPDCDPPHTRIPNRRLACSQQAGMLAASCEQEAPMSAVPCRSNRRRMNA